MGCARLALALLLVVAAAYTGAAQAGGSIRAYVQLPAQGRLLLVDVARGRLVASLTVPPGNGPIVAAIDGSRVLVANTRRGLVTDVDGIHGRRTRTFTGLGHPVDLLLLPRENAGIVRPRYALVADGRGFICTLDLATGTVVRRVAVPRPTRFAGANGRLWVASAGRTTLTELDVSDPTDPRVIAHPRIGIQPVALAIDPDLAVGVDGVSGSGTFVRLDAISGRTRAFALGRPIRQLAAGYGGVLWGAAPHGRVLGIRARDGHVVDVRQAPRDSRISIVGGWLATTHDHALSLFALGGATRRTTTSLPGVAGAAAFAVLP